MKYAPIVLFVYNRLDHTRRTVASLQENTLAKESVLFIYSDAPKDKSTQKDIANVREYIKNIDGFKNIKIIEQKENKGLADSIISGVTEVVNAYGRVIVMEDDLVTSPYFLKFMNEALEFYKGDKKIWHISGWNYPISTNGPSEVFAWQVMNCWGWATWVDRWQYFEKDTNKLFIEFSLWDKFKFNLYGVESFWKQIRLNKNGKSNTWAIYWYAAIFKNKGLCINPIRSFVQNIGLDGSGTNCADVNMEQVLYCDSQSCDFYKKISIDRLIFCKIWFSIFRRRFKRVISKFHYE